MTDEKAAPKPVSAAPSAHAGSPSGTGPRPMGARPSGPGGYRPGGPGGYRGPGGPRPHGGPGGHGGMRGRLAPRRRSCRICQDKHDHIDWKAVNLLRSFITERGKVLSSRSTGTCAGCQRQLGRAIKRARNMALLPTSPL